MPAPPAACLGRLSGMVRPGNRNFENLAMIYTIKRRLLLLSVLALLVGAWVLATNPGVGRRLCDLCDPAEVEELLESAEAEPESEQLVRLSAVIRPCLAIASLGQFPSRKSEFCLDGEPDSVEYLVGHCSVTRAPPQI